MAACVVDTEPTYRITIHGNNGFKSDHLLNQIRQEEKKNNKMEKFQLLLFTDLNLNKSFSQVEPSEEMLELIEQSENGLEVSAVLVLISLTEIFSEGMHKLILKLPYNKFYGFNQKNGKEWWKSVIVVFSFGNIEDELESKAKRARSKNGGIEDIVRKAGGRYICMSNKTPLDELIEILEQKILLLDGKLFVGEHNSARSQEKVNSSLPEQKDAIQTKEREDNGINRRFIIIGERKSGKSTLGNLLLGPQESQLFGTDWYSKPSVKANTFPMGEVGICKMFAGEKRCTCWSNERLRIEVVDDSNHAKPGKQEQSLENCVTKKGNPERITFLILINLNACCFSEEEFKRIDNTAQILSNFSFELFSDAIVVFTHVDELVQHSNKTPGQILNEKLQQEESVHITSLLDLAHQRRIFINAMDFSRINRNEILNKLFKFDNNWGSDSVVKIIDKIRDMNTAFNTPIRIFSDITEEERKEKIYREFLNQYTCIVLKRNKTNCEDLIKLSPPQTPEGNSDKKDQIDRKEQRSSITDKIDVKQITEALKELSTTSRIPIEIISDKTEEESERFLKLSEVLLKGPPIQDDLDDFWTFACIVLTKSNKNQELEILKNGQDMSVPGALTSDVL